MCRGELSAVIDQLMSKCLWSRWKWLWRINGMLSHFPCSPVIRECLWNKTQIKRIIYKVHLELPTKRGTEEICYTNNGERSIKLLTRKNGLVQAEIIRIIRIQIRSKVKLKTVSKKMKFSLSRNKLPKNQFSSLIWRLSYLFGAWNIWSRFSFRFLITSVEVVIFKFEEYSITSWENAIPTKLCSINFK